MSRIDKYEVIEEIARGGMGAVYKALHPQFKKIIAIKEVRADLANNPDILKRFEQEVELLAQLPTHPNIVTVRDALVWEDKLYIVMDYIEGETLGDLTYEASLDVERAATLLEQILSGLEAIHSRGIVHRDLKASNILIDHQGNAYITDFGIAEYTNQQSNAIVMATPRYAAPELIDTRLRRGGTDQQVDIYAAGILGYEMLLGEKTFRESLPDIYDGEDGGSAERWLSWHINLARPAAKLNQIHAHIPKALARVIARMMEKDVSQRYKNVSEIRKDLLAFLGKRQDTATYQQDAPAYFDETVPLDASQGEKTNPGAKTNLVGASTAALYETRPITTADANPPLAHVTMETLASSTTQYPVIGTDEVDGGGRKKSLFIWLTVGCVAVLALALCGWLLWPAKGFTLIVRGAPPGSVVYVDNVESGPTDANGSRIIHELEPGRRTVVIANQGYKDFVATVVAQRGTEELVIANLEKTGADTPSALQKEIDFSGEMVLIPAGDFIMGDDANVKNEGPAHTVNLPDFYIDKFEVSNAQYKAFCEATQRPTPTNTSFHREYFNSQPNSPVLGVSWEDAAAYAAWANKRLPTEEEWEKAASWDPVTQKKRQWPWGDRPEAERANVDSPKRTTKEPYEIGRYARDVSAYGVRDMAGNASEWVDAFYQPYAGNQIADQDFGTTNRVIRGGNFAQPLDQARTTRRQFALPTFREYVENGNEYNSSAGFRCAVSAKDARLQEFLRKK